MKAWLKNVWSEILSYDTRPVEIMASAALALYGFTLVLPFNTFALGLLYVALSKFVSEDFFGMVVFGIGLYGLIARNVSARKHAAFANFLVYLFLASLALATVPYTLANTLPVFVVGSLWCYLRLAKVQNGSTNH